MKRRIPLALVSISLLIFTQLSQAQLQQSKLSTEAARPVPDFFFGIQSGLPDLWPIIPVYNVRLHDTRTSWSDMNPAKGVYDWSVVDRWIAASQKQGAGPILYTFSQTPQWASSNPNDQSCRYGPGECDPPDDLNPDGSGPNQHWKDFVTALAKHAGGPNQIRYWEMWNEPANAFFWTGTYAQLVRMSKDAREIILSIDPKAKLLTPPDPFILHFYQKAWKGYADAGGLQYADIIALHGGVGTYPPQCGDYPESAEFVTVAEQLKTFLASYGVYKPIWDTEGDWGPTDKDCFTDPDLQTAFLGQYYILHRSEGIRRIFWYSYFGFSALYNPTTNQLTKAGVAYQQVHDWMLGNALSNRCSTQGTIWSCPFIGPNGYQAEAVWDTAETCKNGACQTINYQVESRFIQYRTLAGETIAVSNHQVPIGAKPILLENKTGQPLHAQPRSPRVPRLPDLTD